MTRGEYDVNNDNRVESAPPDYQENQLKQRKNGDVLHDDTNKVESIEIPSKEKPYVGYGFKEVNTAKNLSLNRQQFQNIFFRIVSGTFFGQ